MNTAVEKITIEGFQALVFKIQESLFAVDLDQIDELLELHQLESESERPQRLDRLLSFGGQPVVYRDPRVLAIHYQDSRLLLQIDQPQDIVFIRLETMRSFPTLLERVKESGFVWGVGLVREEPVLLVDCHKLASACKAEAGTVGTNFRNSEMNAKT